MDPRWHLSHARGYLELGMLKDALAELNALPPALAASEEALALRATLHQEGRDWPALQVVSKLLVQIRPDSAGAWIMWAYATRRAESIGSAERISVAFTPRLNLFRGKAGVDLEVKDIRVA